MKIIESLRGRFLGRGKDTPAEANKEFAARMVWDRIESLVDAHGTAAFSAVEITKALPEGIRHWDYLDKISAPLIVSIHTNIGRVVKVIYDNADHYVEVVLRGPVDTSPIITEGEISSDGDVPYPTQFADSLEFALKLSIFLSHQRKISQDVPIVGPVLDFRRITTQNDPPNNLL